MAGMPGWLALLVEHPTLDLWVVSVSPMLGVGLLKNTILYYTVLYFTVLYYTIQSGCQDCLNIAIIF